MELNPRLFDYLNSLNTNTLTHAEIAQQLGENGFVNSRGEVYAIKQVSSILHSFRTINRAKEHRPTNGCGIDRESNPCGDASDY